MADVYNHKLVKVERKLFTITQSGTNEYKLRLQAPVLNNDMKHAGSIVIVNFLGEGFSTGTMTSASSVDEGATLTVTVAVTKIPLTTALSWRVNIVSGLTTNDFIAVRGSVENRTETGGNFTITLRRDKLTSPGKVFTITLLKGADVLETSGNITVNDVSQTPTFNVTLQSSANEGSVVPVTVTEVVSSGDTAETTQTLAWSLVSNGGYAALGNYSPINGTVTLSNGTGSFNINVIADAKTNYTAKSFSIKLSNVNGTSVTQNTNPVCAVADTSKESWQGGTASLAAIPSYFKYTEPTAAFYSWSWLRFYPNGTYTAATGGSNPVIRSNWWSITDPTVGANFKIKIDYTQSYRTPQGTQFRFPAASGTILQLDQNREIYFQADNYACTDPTTPILITREGATKPAGELVVGDSVYTMHEITRDWGYYQVVRAQLVTQPKALVTFDDGSTLHASLSHKFYLGRNIWRNLFNLVVGDQVATYTSGVKRTITNIETTDVGDVVSLEIEDAHTYIANNIISHNNKASVDYYGTYLTKIDYNVTVTIYGPPSYNVALATKSFTMGAEVNGYIPEADYSSYWSSWTA